MIALVTIFVLLTSLLFAMAVQWRVWRLFTFRVPLVPKKEDNKIFIILAIIDIILGIVIAINLTE